MLRGPDPFSQKPIGFGGLQSPKWPSQIFAKDPAWQIDPARVSKGRGIYHEICVECHLGPVNDPVFDAQFPDESIWKPEYWDANRSVLTLVQKPVEVMGTDAAQANVLVSRKVELPGFLDLQPARDMQPAPDPGKVSECKDLPLPTTYSSTEMPYSIALMTAVDLVSRKWMNENHVSEADSEAALGSPKKLSQPRERPALSRPPAERRLGNGALPSQRIGALALVDADARSRTPEAILHGFSRFRSGAGWLPRGGP
jgi:hypothetical protein